MTFDELLETSAAASPFAGLAAPDAAAMQRLFMTPLMGDADEDDEPTFAEFRYADELWQIERLDWDSFCRMQDRGGKELDRLAPLLRPHGGQPFTGDQFRELPVLKGKVLMSAVKILGRLNEDEPPVLVHDGDGINHPVVVRLGGQEVSFSAETTNDLLSIKASTHQRRAAAVLALAAGPLPRRLSISEGLFLEKHIAQKLDKAGKDVIKAVLQMEYHSGQPLVDLPLNSLGARFKPYAEAHRQHQKFQAAIAGAKLKGSH